MFTHSFSRLAVACTAVVLCSGLIAGAGAADTPVVVIVVTPASAVITVPGTVCLRIHITDAAGAPIADTIAYLTTSKRPENVRATLDESEHTQTDANGDARVCLTASGTRSAGEWDLFVNQIVGPNLNWVQTTSNTVVVLVKMPPPPPMAVRWSLTIGGAGHGAIRGLYDSRSPTFQPLPGQTAGNFSCEQSCIPPLPIFLMPVTARMGASPHPGSIFTGWTGACAAAGTAPDCVLDTTDGTAFGATFEPAPVTYTTNVIGDGHGSIISDPSGNDCDRNCIATFPPGSTVTFRAVAAPGSVFAGWYPIGPCATSNPIPVCTLSESLATLVVASFKPLPVSLTITLDGGGRGSVVSDPAAIDCGQTCVASLPVGTLVTLWAAAEPLSNFTGWTGACAAAGTSPECSLTLAADSAVGASFTPLPPTTGRRYLNSGSTACRVPRVIGLTVNAARRALAARACRLGTIRRKHSAMVRIGRVSTQTPEAGALARSGAAVAVVVNSGR